MPLLCSVTANPFGTTQRKVKFPNEFDALEIATDELREKMRPITSRRGEIEKARDERRKVRKRTRAAVPAAQAPSANVGSSTEANVEVPSSGDVRMDDGTNEPGPEQSAGGELRPEEWYREKEKAELEALVDPSIKSDTGASQTGLYELAGELPLFFHRHWCTITLARLFSYHHA